MPPALWRALVLILALCGTTQLVIELLSAPRVLTLGVATQLLFGGTYEPVRGPTQFLVDSVPSESPLVAVGVKPGDRVYYDEPLGHWPSRVAGDSLTLTAKRDGASRRVEVDVPAAEALPRFQIASYTLGTV